jgi:hypothetical protein
MPPEFQKKFGTEKACPKSCLGCVGPKASNALWQTGKEEIFVTLLCSLPQHGL